MMTSEVKLFEVRDSMTYIPVVATRINVALVKGEQELSLLRKTGWSDSNPAIIVARLGDGHGRVDPYDWPGDTRTMPNAHAHIIANWDTLASGDVIDVEFLLGITKEKKLPDRLTVL